MQPIRLGEGTPEEIAELDQLFRSAPSMRLRMRAQMILLSIERKLVAHEIASIVRLDEQTVRRWLKRYQAEGAAGLQDAPQPGRPPEITSEYRSRLLEVVRLRPRALDQPFSLWTLQRLSDFMAEERAERFSYESVRRVLREGGIVLSRPQHKITSPDPEYQVKKRRLKRAAITLRSMRCSTMQTSST